MIVVIKKTRNICQEYLLIANTSPATPSSLLPPPGQVGLWRLPLPQPISFLAEHGGCAATCTGCGFMTHRKYAESGPPTESRMKRVWGSRECRQRNRFLKAGCETERVSFCPDPRPPDSRARNLLGRAHTVLCAPACCTQKQFGSLCMRLFIEVILEGGCQENQNTVTMMVFRCSPGIFFRQFFGTFPNKKMRPFAPRKTFARRPPVTHITNKQKEERSVGCGVYSTTCIQNLNMLQRAWDGICPLAAVLLMLETKSE